MERVLLPVNSLRPIVSRHQIEPGMVLRDQSGFLYEVRQVESRFPEARGSTLTKQRRRPMALCRRLPAPNREGFEKDETRWVNVDTLWGCCHILDHNRR